MDRNFQVCTIAGGLFQSLSARRAWIEIKVIQIYKILDCVALRKESVDRNIGRNRKLILIIRSLSARRAWIEIAYVS